MQVLLHISAESRRVVFAVKVDSVLKLSCIAGDSESPPIVICHLDGIVSCMLLTDSGSFYFLDQSFAESLIQTDTKDQPNSEVVFFCLDSAIC